MPSSIERATKKCRPHVSRKLPLISAGTWDATAYIYPLLGFDAEKSQFLGKTLLSVHFSHVF